MNIFLFSSFADSYRSFITETNIVFKNKKIVFIPTASNVEENAFYVTEALKVLSDLEADIKILDLDKHSTESIKKEIKNCDYIYVTGGNTFYLLQQLKEKKVDIFLANEIRSGKHYFGESAGCIILSPDIEYISILDDKNKAPYLHSYRGLSLLNFSPVPHFKNKYIGDCIKDILMIFQDKNELVPFQDTEFILANHENFVVK